MPIVELEDVTRTYGAGESEVRAVDGVSLAIEPGEFTVLSGPSGSGKTTLLNLIGCLDAPTSGTVRVDGQDVTRLGGPALARLRARRIGFIFQSFNLIPVLTALENVELALLLGGRRGDGPLARSALEAVGLGGHLHRRPNQLSGGQQQRVAVARALVKEPALVVADEPTANLDSANGAAVLDLMRHMNEEHGITFLFSTHDPRVMSRARRVMVLQDGCVVSDESRTTQPPRED